MPLDFVFKDDKSDFPFEPVETSRGISFSRSGLVTAADPVAALLDPSVPGIGALYSADLSLKVASRSVQHFGGRVGSDQPPTYKVTVVYETPAFGGGVRPETAGEVWTEVESSTTSLTVYDDVVPPSAGSVRPPINGGDGATREVGTLEAQVKQVYTLEGFAALDYSRLVTLNKGFVNSDAVQLPRMYKTPLTLNMSPGQVRYKSFSVDRDGEYVVLTHHLALAPDHKLREIVRDAAGLMTSNVRERILYESTSFAGLWS